MLATSISEGFVAWQKHCCERSSEGGFSEIKKVDRHIQGNITLQ